MTRLTDDALAELARLDSLRQSHNVCDDCWYSCPKSEGGCCNDLSDGECNCGADAHNARVDAVASTVAALVAEVQALRAEVERAFGVEMALRADLDQALRRAGNYAGELRALRAAELGLQRQAHEWRQRATLYASQLQSLANTAAPIAAAVDAPAGMILDMAVRDSRRVLDGARAALDGAE